MEITRNENCALPSRPADIEDDGEFHYAVLNPKAASESGKPNPEARKFVDETTSADRPRATNRNAVVLAVPSKDGIQLARERVRDALAWEQAREMLRSREDVDTVRLAQLETNLKVARSEMASHIVMSYCIVVTVNDANEIAAFRLNVDNVRLGIRALPFVPSAGASFEWKAMLTSVQSPLKNFDSY